MKSIPDELISKLRKAKRVSVLTGAGVSKESGVPTFRDPDGLWKKFRPEELASMEGFLKNPTLVSEWYQHRRDLLKNIQPNKGHFALVEMERRIPQFTLITQNVDSLHFKAGGKNILELHGNIERNFCLQCHRYVEADPIPLHCPECQGLIRPDIVWFGEMLPADILRKAQEATQNCDLFFSIGTSTQVYPAAQLPFEAKDRGALVVEINPDKTPFTSYADFSLMGPSAEILPQLIEFTWGVKL